MPAQFEVYEDKGGKYRWRLKAANGQIVAQAGRASTARATLVKPPKPSKSQQHQPSGATTTSATPASRSRVHFRGRAQWSGESPFGHHVSNPEE